MKISWYKEDCRFLKLAPKTCCWPQLISQQLKSYWNVMRKNKSPFFSLGQFWCWFIVALREMTRIVILGNWKFISHGRFSDCIVQTVSTVSETLSLERFSLQSQHNPQWFLIIVFASTQCCLSIAFDSHYWKNSMKSLILVTEITPLHVFRTNYW